MTELKRVPPTADDAERVFETVLEQAIAGQSPPVGIGFTEPVMRWLITVAADPTEANIKEAKKAFKQKFVSQQSERIKELAKQFGVV